MFLLYNYFLIGFFLISQVVFLYVTLDDSVHFDRFGWVFAIVGVIGLFNLFHLFVFRISNCLGCAIFDLFVWVIKM